jgi:hypothetical protein
VRGCANLLGSRVTEDAGPVKLPDHAAQRLLQRAAVHSEMRTAECACVGWTSHSLACVHDDWKHVLPPRDALAFVCPSIALVIPRVISLAAMLEAAMASQCGLRALDASKVMRVTAPRDVDDVIATRRPARDHSGQVAPSECLPGLAEEMALDCDRDRS